MTARRFPPPWSVEDACFIVRDAAAAPWPARIGLRRRLPVPDPPTMAREAEEEWNKARPRRSLFDMDQKALVLRSPAAR